MKKDKQWLEKELRNLEKLVKEALEASLIAKNEHYTEKNSNELQLLRRVFSLVNQLDEPEVLSQELPVIPQFVADYIDDRKEASFPLYQAIRIVRENSRFEGDSLREWLWTNKGQETFARAWLDGFTIEEEQRYYVDLETAAYVAKWDGNGQVDIYTDGISGSDEYEFHLTEKEIKDYDDRFWAFRKPVEELEE